MQGIVLLKTNSDGEHLPNYSDLSEGGFGSAESEVYPVIACSLPPVFAS